MTKTALALSTVLLVATPTAAAKGVASAEVCGAGGCRALDPRGPLSLDRLIPYGRPVDAPPHLPSYRVRLAFAGPELSLTENRAEPAQLVDVTYVPAARAAHYGGPKGVDPWRDDAWSALAGPSLRAFRRATAGLEPLPAGALRPAAARLTDDGGPLGPAIAAGLALLAVSGAALLERGRRTQRQARDSGGPSERIAGQTR